MSNRVWALYLLSLCLLFAHTNADDPPAPMRPTFAPTTHYHHANAKLFDLMSMGALGFMMFILLVSFVGGCYLTKTRGRNGFTALMDYLQGVDEEFSEMDSTLGSGSFDSVDLSSNTSRNGWKQVSGNPLTAVVSPLALIENTKLCLEMYERLFGDLNVPIVSPTCA